MEKEHGNSNVCRGFILVCRDSGHVQWGFIMVCGLCGYRIPETCLAVKIYIYIYIYVHTYVMSNAGRHKQQPRVIRRRGERSQCQMLPGMLESPTLRSLLCSQAPVAFVFRDSCIGHPY